MKARMRYSEFLSVNVKIISSQKSLILLQIFRYNDEPRRHAESAFRPNLHAALDEARL